MRSTLRRTQAKLADAVARLRLNQRVWRAQQLGDKPSEQRDAGRIVGVPRRPGSRRRCREPRFAGARERAKDRVQICELGDSVDVGSAGSRSFRGSAPGSNGGSNCTCASPAFRAGPVVSRSPPLPPFRGRIVSLASERGEGTCDDTETGAAMPGKGLTAFRPRRLTGKRNRPLLFERGVRRPRRSVGSVEQPSPRMHQALKQDAGWSEELLELRHDA